MHVGRGITLSTADVKKYCTCTESVFMEILSVYASFPYNPYVQLQIYKKESRERETKKVKFGELEKATTLINKVKIATSSCRDIY